MVYCILHQHSQLLDPDLSCDVMAKPRTWPRGGADGVHGCAPLDGYLLVAWGPREPHPTTAHATRATGPRREDFQDPTSAEA